MRMRGRNSRARRGHVVVVEELRLGVGAVGPLLEHLAGDVRPEAVGQVPAGVEGHAEHPLVAEGEAQARPVLVAEVVDVLGAGVGEGGRLDPVGEHGPEGDQVGVDAGVRLDVRVGGAEEGFGMVGGELLDGVDVLATGVEAVADRALGVLVGEPRAHGEEDRRRGVVLAGDELQRAALVGQLGADGTRDGRLDRADDIQRAAVGDDAASASGIGHRQASSSMSRIWSIRRWCRPPGERRRQPQPEDLVGEVGATMRPPMASTLASLCSRLRRAVYRSLHSAARTPRTLFAAICSPWPLPPSTIPRSASPLTTVRPTSAQIGG